MVGEFDKVGNGGSWSYGSSYAGGWFWEDPSLSCTNHVSTKKDVVPKIGEENPNFTLSDGTIVPVDRRVWLDLSSDKAVLSHETRYM